MENNNENSIDLLIWNVCIKLKNTPQITNYFNNLKENSKLPDICAIQEAVKILEPSDDLTDFDTYTCIENYYNSNIFDGAFNTKFMDANGGKEIQMNGRYSQGQMINTNLEIVENKSHFFLGQYKEVTSFSLEEVKNQPRLYQKVLLKKNDTVFQIVNLHGAWNENKNGGFDSTIMVNDLIQNFKDCEIPTILVGDFNLIPTSKEITMLNENFINLNNVYKIRATRPLFYDGLDRITSDNKQQTVDYIFVNNKIDIEKSSVFVDYKNNYSDHYPILFDFNIKQ